MSEKDQKVPERAVSSLSPTQVGRYRILGRIGYGGMATVYLGQSEGPSGFERLVAIKLLHEHLCMERRLVEMFLDEARVAARIRHPNVVPVIEVGQDSGRYFLVMEYINGEALGELMVRSWRKTKSFPIEIAAYLAASASEGLHAAHELTNSAGELLQVVHRDVSPQNFIVGYDGVIRITDFGVVKVANAIPHTQSGVKGKFAYMSPEQALGDDVDRRTDLFALGVVFWELLAGRRLFKAKTDFGTVQNVCQMSVPPPSKYNPAVPEELNRIIRKLLKRSSNNRYDNAQEVAEDFRRFLISKGGSIFTSNIANFMKEICSERLAKKQEMERKFQNEEACDANQVFEKNSGDNLLETVEENIDGETPSNTEARELRNALVEKLAMAGSNTFEDSVLDDDSAAEGDFGQIAPAHDTVLYEHKKPPELDATQVSEFQAVEDVQAANQQAVNSSRPLTPMDVIGLTDSGQQEHDWKNQSDQLLAPQPTVPRKLRLVGISAILTVIAIIAVWFILSDSSPDESSQAVRVLAPVKPEATELKSKESADKAAASPGSVPNAAPTALPKSPPAAESGSSAAKNNDAKPDVPERKLQPRQTNENVKKVSPKVKRAIQKKKPKRKKMRRPKTIKKKDRLFSGDDL